MLNLSLLLVLVLTSTTTPTAGATPTPTWWHPSPTSSWQIQLDGELDLSLDVAIYDLDLFDTPVHTIRALHADDSRVICYFSAGSQEAWRPDATAVPARVVGQPLDNWPDERWLDIRADAVRQRILTRLDLAVDKGCDGIDPDNVDGYANPTGFPLRATDQLTFNRWLAGAAHDRGLAIGLKNDLEQVTELVEDFDWALNEECFRYDECAVLRPVVAAGKPVFQIEYGPPSLAEGICPMANALGFATLIKNLALDAPRTACRD